MKKYKVEYAKASNYGTEEDIIYLESRLNSLAAEGWRLVSSSPIAASEGVTSKILLFFERDK